MDVAVIGTGYVGLVTGVCLADQGHQVICVDNDKTKLELLQKGQAPIYEPGLDELLLKNFLTKRLVFTENLQEAVEKSEVIFLCLPTPPLSNGAPNLRYLWQVVEQIGDYFYSSKLLVIKSTVPIGTTQQIGAFLSEKTNCSLDIAFNPEFLREGSAIQDFLKPDRVIIGTSSNRAQQLLTAIYLPIVVEPDKLVFMDERSAEATKYAANVFLATKISFINEIANFCETKGVNVDLVSLGIGLDHRIGPYFLQAGIGYGGSCFPKDVAAMLAFGQEIGYHFKILEAVKTVNQHQRELLISKVLAVFKQDLANKVLSVWGLAFKANTDDIRDSPAVAIVTELCKLGATLQVFDPQAMLTAQRHLDLNITYANDMYAAANQAEALIILTDWPEFRNVDFARLASVMSSKIIVDGRNLYPLDTFQNLDFTYISMGRPAIVPKS